MRVRSKILSSLFAIALVASPALGDAPRAGDHLSYYTYYKTEQGETVSAVAGKFGLAKSSLLRMNPQLSEQLEELPEGSMLCVPQEKSGETDAVEKMAARNTPKAREAEKVESEPAPKKKKRSKKSVKDREEPDDDEWEQLADMATKGAPKMARRVVREVGPSSKMITSDGRVVWIPAAKAAPKAEPKASRSSRKGERKLELASRKGKAIYGVIKTCRSYMGTPYVWGGEQPGGFDCSGYVQYVFAKHGYRLPRTADIQYNVGKSVKRGDERPGDLVFFETYAPGASHVGVYLGRDYFIHASSSRGVTIDRLSTDFFAQRYLGAKRQSF